MNVNLDPAEIRWLMQLADLRGGELRAELATHIKNGTQPLPSGTAMEMRRAVAVAEKLEAALRPGKAAHA